MLIDVKNQMREINLNDSGINNLIIAETSLRCEIDQEKNFTSFSPECSKVYGYKNEDLIGTSSLNLIHPQDRQQFKKLLNRVLTNKQPLESIFRMITRDKTTKWIKVIAAYNGENQNHSSILINAKDITEQKLIEEKLIESELRTKRLLEASEDIIVIHDREGRYVYFNGPSKYGVSIKDLKGKSPYDLFEKEQADRIIGQIKKVVKSGKGCNEENCVTWQDQKMWFLDQIIPIKDDKGKITHIAKICVNITDKKKAELARDKEHKKLRAVFDALPGLTHVVDTKMNIIDVGDKMLRFYNIASLREALGKKCYEVFKKRTTICPDCKLAQCMQKNKSTARVSYKNEFGNPGKYFKINTAPITNEQNTVEGGVQCLTEITDLINTEKQLKYSEAKFKMLYTQSPLPYQSLNQKGNILEINNAWLKMMGYEHDEVIGKNFSCFLSGKDKKTFKHKFEKFKNRGSIKSIEMNLCAKAGKIIPVEIDGKISYDHFGEMKQTHSVLREITERKRSEILRKKFTLRLEEKNHELENILHIASHDMRTPLVNIKGFSGELENSFDEISKLLKNNQNKNPITDKIQQIYDDDITDYLGFIKSSVDKMNSLLNALLRLARLGNSALKYEQINMTDMINEITNSMKYQIQDKNIELNIGNLPDCKGDKEQLSQVFSNLISNAIKYIDKEKGHIKINGGFLGNETLYCVKDNGSGIEKNDLEKVFQIFWRTPADNSKYSEGLGLAIVRRIVDRHHGRVWAESTKGEGSSFYVLLPNRK